MSEGVREEGREGGRDERKGGVNTVSCKHVQQSLHNPKVHMLGEGSACIAYQRIIEDYSVQQKVREGRKGGREGGSE